MKKRYLIIFFIIIFLITGCAKEIPQENINKPIENEEEIIYEKDDGIQKILSLYNKLFPNDSIQKEMITTYYHHGREHDNQIQFTLEGNKITLSNRYSDNNQYNIEIVLHNDIDDNDKVRDIAFRFMKLFNNSLTDDELNNFWEEENKSNFPNKKELEGIDYNVRTKVGSNEIEYMTIGGSIDIA